MKPLAFEPAQPAKHKASVKGAIDWQSGKIIIASMMVTTFGLT
ncbi:MAG: hypothetical protein V7679_04555 [Parasphingorhabdus sp.]